MKTRMRHCACVAATLMIALFGCARSNPVSTPQAPSLDHQAVQSSIHGVFVTTSQEFAIIGIDIPSGKRRIIRPAPGPTDNRDSVFAVAGPDSAGLVAFVRDTDKSFELKVISLDGSLERSIFTRPGDPIWQDAVGKHIALSNHGGRVALIGKMHGVQMPSALLQAGPLEVWDVSSQKHVALDSVLDLGDAWLLDDKNLACVRLVPRSELTIDDPADDHFGLSFLKWDRVPAVYLVNVDTGAERLVCTGVNPIVSADGQTLLVADFPTEEGMHWRRVDIATGAFTPIPLSSTRSFRSYVAVGASDASLYSELPGPGESSGKTKYYSPLRGPQPLLLLKAGKLGGVGGEVMCDDIDARASVSFGTPESGR